VTVARYFIPHILALFLANSSCTATLKFNGYVIALLPPAGFKDGFKQGLSELEFSGKLTALQRENVSLRAQPG
jgi:hypothetical protein